MSGETIFITNGKPIEDASFRASAALPATPSCGTLMPYASHTCLPSGAVREFRPAALTASRICLTLVFIFCSAKNRGENVAPVGAPDLDLNNLRGFQLRDLAFGVAELRQYFLGVLAQQRRALDFGGAVGHLDRVAHGEVLAARGMVDFDHGAGGTQGRFLGDLL